MTSISKTFSTFISDGIRAQIEANYQLEQVKAEMERKKAEHAALYGMSTSTSPVYTTGGINTTVYTSPSYPSHSPLSGSLLGSLSNPGSKTVYEDYMRQNYGPAPKEKSFKGPDGIGVTLPS